MKIRETVEEEWEAVCQTEDEDDQDEDQEQ